MALARPQEVKDALRSKLLDWIEEVENSFRKSLDKQEGPVDQVHSPHHGQSLSWEDSRQWFVQQ